MQYTKKWCLFNSRMLELARKVFWKISREKPRKYSQIDSVESSMSNIEIIVLSPQTCEWTHKPRKESCCHQVDAGCEERAGSVLTVCLSHITGYFILLESKRTKLHVFIYIFLNPRKLLNSSVRPELRARRMLLGAALRRGVLCTLHCHCCLSYAAILFVLKMHSSAFLQ